MAGHSQFKNIMHRKGRAGRPAGQDLHQADPEITTAARSGLPDPNANPRLRAAVIAARGSQHDARHDRSRDQARLGRRRADANYDEVRYEGYGPGGVAVIVEALTDNRNRTAGEVRSTFSKHGGNLGETNSVSFMFDRVGEFRFPLERRHADEVLKQAIEAGADDVVSGDGEDGRARDLPAQDELQRRARGAREDRSASRRRPS